MTALNSDVWYKDYLEKQEDVKVKELLEKSVFQEKIRKHFNELKLEEIEFLYLLVCKTFQVKQINIEMSITKRESSRMIKKIKSKLNADSILSIAKTVWMKLQK